MYQKRAIADADVPRFNVSDDALRKSIIEHIENNKSFDSIPEGVTPSRMLSLSLQDLHQPIHNQIADADYVHHSHKIQKELLPVLRKLRGGGLDLTKAETVEHLGYRDSGIVHPQESVVESMAISLASNPTVRKNIAARQSEVIGLLERYMSEENWSTNDLCYQSRRDELLIHNDPLQTIYELLQLAPEPLLRDNTPLSELLGALHQNEAPRISSLGNSGDSFRFPYSFCLSGVNLLNGNVNWAVRHFNEHVGKAHSSTFGDAFLTGLSKLSDAGVVDWYVEYIQLAAKIGMIANTTLVTVTPAILAKVNNLDVLTDDKYPGVGFFTLGDILLSTHINIYQCIMSGELERRVACEIDAQRNATMTNAAMVTPKKGLRL